MNERIFRALFLAVFGVSALQGLVAQTAQPPIAVNRIVAPVDESSLVPLKGNIHPLAQARFDQGVAPLSTPTGRIMLILQRSAAQQQALAHYLADLQNPSSPNFHHWLTPGQYGARFGISDSDLQTVESWLETHGFKIENVPAARNAVQFSGTFGDLQSAFHLSIHTYVIQGASHFANPTEPKIPAALASVIGGVTPLNDFRPKANVQPGPKGHYDASNETLRPELVAGGFLYVTPADAATIYDSPNSALNPNYKGTTYDGSGINIGIAGDSNINTPDIANYRTAFLGESSGSPRLPTVVIDGNDPGVNGDEVEALLDNEIAGGIAPRANLYFYTSAGTELSSGVFSSILRAINDNVISILNISFGVCEASAGSGGNQFILEATEQAAAQGISVTVASGDSGSAGCDDPNTETSAQGGFGVNALASTPYVIAVGGTDYDVLSTDFNHYAGSAAGTEPYYGTVSQYIPENPWNNSTSVNAKLASNQVLMYQGASNIAAAGGGVSAVYGKPSFQTTSLTPNDGHRDVPDVSLLSANGNYQVAWLLCEDSQASGQTDTPSEVDCVNTNGQLASGTTIDGVGGTSAAAPAFAGMLALVEQANGGARLGQADFILYQLAQSKYSTVFHDVTVGNNAVVCASGTPNCSSNGFLTGYDTQTGYDLASGLGSVDVAAMISNWGSVALTSTTTTLNVDGSTAAVTGAHGTPLTFNVGVNPTSATGVATLTTTAGTSGASGAAALNPLAIHISGGSGSVTYNGLPGGTYTLAAEYSGDAANAASTSNGIDVSISPEPSTTSVSMVANSAVTGNGIPTTNIPYGSEIVADAQITGTKEGLNTQGLATGTVSFKDGSGALGKVAVDSNNIGSYPPLSSAFSVFTVGSHSIIASYSGDASYDPSTSGATSFTVVKAVTSTTAKASQTNVSSGSSSTVAVNVTSPYNYGVAPTGSIALTLGNTALGNVGGLTGKMSSSGSWTLSGSITVTASQLASSTNIITAAYSGDANYASSSASVTITAPSTATPGISLSSSSSNISLAAGASTGNTSIVTVSPSGGFRGAVKLSCSVSSSMSKPNDLPACELTSPVTISGTTPATATLTVKTTAATIGALSLPLEKYLLGGGGTALAVAFLFGIPARRRAWRILFSVLAVSIVMSGIGCGTKYGAVATGKLTPGTTAGTYTVTITGADAATGKVTATTTVTLTVH